MMNNTEVEKSRSRLIVDILDRTAQTVCVIMVLTLSFIIIYRTWQCQSLDDLETIFTHIFTGIVGYIARQQLGR